MGEEKLETWHSQGKGKTDRKQRRLDEDSSSSRRFESRMDLQPQGRHLSVRLEEGSVHGFVAIKQINNLSLVVVVFGMKDKISLLFVVVVFDIQD